MSQGSDIHAQASNASEHSENNLRRQEQASAESQEAQGNGAQNPSGNQVETADSAATNASNGTDTAVNAPNVHPDKTSGSQAVGSHPNNETGTVSSETRTPDPVRLSDELIPDFLRPPKRPAQPAPQPEDLPVRMVIPSDSNEAYVMEAPSEEVRRAKREKYRQERRKQQAGTQTADGKRIGPQGIDDERLDRARTIEGAKTHRSQFPHRREQATTDRKRPRNRRSDRQQRQRGAAQSSARNANKAPQPVMRRAGTDSKTGGKNAGATEASPSAQSPAAAVQKRKHTQVLAVALLAAIIVAIGGIAAATGAFGPAASNDTTGSTVAQTATANSTDNDNTLSPDEVKTALKQAGLSSSEADKAAKAAENDKRISQIAGNADAYKKEGNDVQTKLLELAVDDPEAIDFVLNWPESYPEDKGQAYDEKVKKGTIPQLYQWDERWGYTTYSGTTFARTGCGPTALSMVYMGLTGKTDKTPYDMGQLAREDGYESPHNGTVGDFLVDDAPKLGLSCQNLNVDADSLRAWLNQGGVIICNVGAGDFTDGGHFFVITGLDKKGKLTIHDPYSSVRSAEHWSVNRILGQTVALYGFTAAN